MNRRLNRRLTDPAPRAADAVRLAVGTLTALPVRPPRAVDRTTAGRALLLAPVVGLGLALLVATPVGLLTGRVPSPLLAVLSVATLAAMTRCLHLDGLADTADGLGCGRSPAAALAVMRRSDIGPFGVVTLVLVLATQLAALAALVDARWGAVALAAAVVASRGVLPLLGTRRHPAARADGMGAAYAACLGGRAAFAGGAVTAVAAAAAAGLAAALPGPPDALGADRSTTLALLGLQAPATVAGLLLARRAVRRLGGVTGDVYGACVETTFTAGLLLAALLV